MMKIQDIRKRNEDKLLKMRNVVGVGVGKKLINGKETDRQCIRVYVSKKKPIAELRRKDIAPLSVDHAETDVIEIGEVVAQAYTEYMRPAKCGISIGHYKVSAGTLGCLVRDKDTEEILILSNNHVLANSNKAEIRDAIWQPGKHDGGTPANLIALLLRFVKIEHRNPWWAFWKKEGKNLVDCAVASPIDDNDVLPEILEIGIPNGTAKAEIGMKLQKTGRTTGYTKGEVMDNDVTITVNYGKFIAKFEHQIMAGAMSKGGDSGSAVLDMDKKVIGLLFAGSDKVTIMNPIDKVMELLNVEI